MKKEISPALAVAVIVALVVVVGILMWSRSNRDVVNIDQAQASKLNKANK